MFWRFGRNRGIYCLRSRCWRKRQYEWHVQLQLKCQCRLKNFIHTIEIKLPVVLFSKPLIMAVSNRINPYSRLNNDTGFSTTGNINGGRFINRNGTFNLRKVGWPIWRRYSIYYRMISFPLWKFIGIIFLFFIGINILYTLIYLWIGPGEFTGMISRDGWKMYKELYFFSTETFTTVGYGRVNPDRKSVV